MGINLVKYLCWRLYFRGTDNAAQKARDMAEPEDQEYYGIGSRSARWMTNMWIGLLFCQICPFILLFVAVNFLICKMVYGFSVVFAEDRKFDMGGELWVSKLWHLQLAVLVYAFTMIGYLDLNGPTAQEGGNLLWEGGKTCSLIASSSLMYWFWSVRRFHQLQWRHLPFSELETEADHIAQKCPGSSYVQNEFRVCRPPASPRDGYSRSPSRNSYHDLTNRPPSSDSDDSTTVVHSKSSGSEAECGIAGWT